MGNTYIFDDSHDYTGAVATFTDTHGTSRITNISVPLSPIQDLHGYSSPWPAGGGKNKYSGGDVIVSNTLFANVPIDPIPAGTYTVSAVIGTAVTTCRVAFRKQDSSALEAVNIPYVSGGRSYATITLPDTAYRIYFYYAGSTSGTGNQTYTDIQIESGSSPTSFAPYSNICTISGRTGFSAYRTGINIWDEEWERGTIGLTTGAKIDDNTKIRSKNYVPISPNTAYYYKFPGNWRMIYFDADKNVVEQGNTYSPNIILTSPATAHYLLFALGGTTEYDNNIAINYPATDHDYHAYNGNTYAVDWTTEAGTVYGGSLDVVTGVLTVNKVVVDLGTLSWSSGSTSITGKYRFLASLPDSAVTSDTSVGATSLCSQYVALETAGTFSASNNGYTIARSNVYIYDASHATDNASTFQNAMSGVQLVYELATPLTYQLTAQEVSVIKNSLNNVWASTGSSITVTVKDIAYGFQGWLVKVGSSLTLVPTEMIEAESYKVTPDQRMEESAERDTTGYLWRDTVRNTPPKIEFNTPPVNNTQVAALNAIFQSAFTVKSQRKLQVAFFDPEEDCYKIWDCYMPDVEYPMHLIDPDAKTILYDSIRYAFIGY